MTALRERARTLRALHRPGAPLILPNAWDVWSARAVAAAGAPAVATTSAGVAESLGYEDGEAMPAGVAMAALGRVAAAVDVGEGAGTGAASRLALTRCRT